MIDEFPDLDDRIEALGVPVAFWGTEDGLHGAWVDWPGWPLVVTRHLDGEVVVRATVAGTSEADIEDGDLPCYVLGAEVADRLGDIAFSVDPDREEVRITLPAGDDMPGACARLAAFAPVAAAAVDAHQDLVEPPVTDFDELVAHGPW